MNVESATMNLEPNGFKRLAKAGQLQIGIWSTLCSPINTEILADCGFDWILLDTEHSPLEVSDVLTHLHAAARGRSAMVVRPAWNDNTLIKRFLDLGVQTLLIPFVQSAEEAQRTVSACLYPPKGIRGVSGSARGSRYGRVAGYFEKADDEICVIVQVETREALANIEAIAMTEGVDGVFVGPSDLAASFGQLGNPAHADVQAAIKHAGEQIRACGKAAGILAVKEEDARRYMDWGFNFVAVGVDVSILSKAADTLLGQFKK